MEALQVRLRKAAKFYFEPAERFFHQHIGRFCNTIKPHILVEPYSYIFDGTESKLVEDFLNKDPEFRDYRVVGYCLVHSFGHWLDKINETVPTFFSSESTSQSFTIWHMISTIFQT